MIKIKIDNRIAFKGTLQEWIARPPDEFRNAIQPTAKPQPWLKAVMIALADAVTMNKAMNITVSTTLKGIHRGWSMQVVEPQ